LHCHTNDYWWNSIDSEQMSERVGKKRSTIANYLLFKTRILLSKLVFATVHWYGSWSSNYQYWRSDIQTNIYQKQNVCPLQKRWSRTIKILKPSCCESKDTVLMKDEYKKSISNYFETK
jgi:hypothetical protein